MPSNTEVVEESWTPLQRVPVMMLNLMILLKMKTKQTSEVQAYQMKKVTLSEDKHVLGFWQANENNVPGLKNSSLAWKVFAAVMSSSSTSEKNFSLAEHVVSARRSSLKNSYINYILFLNSAIYAKRMREWNYYNMIWKLTQFNFLLILKNWKLTIDVF